MIGCFSLIIVDMVIYDTVMYTDDTIENCDLIINKSQALNEVVWLIQRFITHIVWTYPIIYVFWPKIVKNNQNLIKVENEDMILNTENDDIGDDSRYSSWN